jgi:hypothetical protein
MWEIDEAPTNTVMDSDAGLFLQRDSSDPRPDLMYHIYTVVRFSHRPRERTEAYVSPQGCADLLELSISFSCSLLPTTPNAWATIDQRRPSA